MSPASCTISWLVCLPKGNEVLDSSVVNQRWHLVLSRVKGSRPENSVFLVTKEMVGWLSKWEETLRRVVRVQGPPTVSPFLLITPQHIHVGLLHLSPKPKSILCKQSGDPNVRRRANPDYHVNSPTHVHRTGTGGLKAKQSWGRFGKTFICQGKTWWCYHQTLPGLQNGLTEWNRKSTLWIQILLLPLLWFCFFVL